ncbi:MAG: GNAT family N-acetyltransferase, partial [Pirellulaceae bacterium]
MIDFAGNWSDYWASRSPKFRSNIRRCESRAAGSGEVTYERYRPLGAGQDDGDPHWDLYDECFGLAQRSWQGASRRGTTLSHKSVDRYFREMHTLAAHHGVVDVNVLRIDGRVIAFAYNYHFDGRLYGVRMGYDSEYSSLSPGSLLLVRSLKDSFARGDTRLDLATDPAAYKEKWRTGTRASYRYTYYAPASPRSQLLRLKHHSSSICRKIGKWR